MKFEKICVMGLGYIGLPTASTFATHGLQVVGVDVNAHILQTIRAGDLHIHEPGLRTLVQAAIGSGNMRVSEQPEKADVFIIAVPTPFRDGKRADLSYVEAAAHSISAYLRPGNLVVLESTSPPRTTQDFLAPILERSGLKAGNDFHLVYSPERVLPGQILRELIENARVIGGLDRASAEAGRDLYKIFVRGDIFLTDATTAEMVKLMENTYRDINIAIANEFSRLADRFGIDVWEAIAIANRHPRVNILRPGPGVGGHCIGVDPWFLVEAAPDLTHLTQSARLVNDAQPGFVVDMVKRAVGRALPEQDLSGVSTAVLGLAYKPDVDDLRESPAIEVVRQLVEFSAQVKVFDPYCGQFDIPGAIRSLALEHALEQADLILLLVAHAPFLELDPAWVIGMTPARMIIDAVNGWSSPEWSKIGFDVYRLGVGSGR